MMNELKQLRSDGGLEQNEAFAAYFKALEGIPSNGEKAEENLECFKAMESTFIDSFTTTYIEHVASCWLNPKIIFYILGVDLQLAQYFSGGSFTVKIIRV